AANEQFHKTAFYAAEGGAASGIEILEQNICCANGFTATGTGRRMVRHHRRPRHKGYAAGDGTELRLSWYRG
ncbi:MAG: hypothetical protein R3308_10415, partial [Thiohalobacterales bacterium]|nr:hypothetical protein [Thiohalobacterales bacterium]